jgi:hypothetical protein
MFLDSPSIRLVPKLDRRSQNRLPVPSCLTCGSLENVHAVKRTECIVYFHCVTCRTDLVTPIETRSVIGPK